MTAGMTPRERILAAYARQEVDRIPVCPCLTRWTRGHYGCNCEMHMLRETEELGFDPVVQYGMWINHPISSDYVYRPDAAGGYRDLPGVQVEMRVENERDKTTHIRRFETPEGVLTDRIEWCRAGIGYGDGPNPHRAEPLVKSLDDIPALRHLYPKTGFYPKSRQGWTDDLKWFTEFVGERGLVEYNEFSISWGVEALGPENMLICAVEDRELLKAVLRVCQDQHLYNLKTVLESGHKHYMVNWFQSSLSTGWSPGHIEEFFLPLIRESADLVHSYGGTYRFFDDGKMKDMIPRLIDMGIEVACGLQPPPVGDCIMGELKQEYGDRICLFGGLDPINTFELGSAQTVRAAVTELLEQVGDGRGIIINTAEAFGPETPAECLHEWIKAVREWRPGRT